MSEHANMAAADLDHMARLRQERDAARADNAALWDALDDALVMSQIPQDLWVSEGWGGTFERINALHDADHPGAPLLALLTAARAYRAAVRAVDGIADAEATLLAAIDAMDMGKE